MRELNKLSGLGFYLFNLEECSEAYRTLKTRDQYHFLHFKTFLAFYTSQLDCQYVVHIVVIYLL